MLKRNVAIILPWLRSDPLNGSPETTSQLSWATVSRLPWWPSSVLQPNYYPILSLVPQAAIISHKGWQTPYRGLIHLCEFNCFFSFLHMPASHAFPFLTINGAEIIVTRACGSQRTYQLRNRPCDSVVFSLSTPGVSSMRTVEEELWISQSLDPSSWMQSLNNDSEFTGYDYCVASWLVTACICVCVCECVCSSGNAF